MPRKKGMPLDIQTDDRLAVIGQPGTGKTVFLKYLASLIPPDRLKIYDPLDQYQQFEDENRIVPVDSNPLQEFNTFARQMMAVGNKTIFVEEAQRYFPQDRPLPDDTAAMLNRGRNLGIGVFAISQRIAHINNNFFDLAQTLIIFRPGSQSYQALKRMLPKDAYNAVIHLPDYQYVHISLRTEEWSKSTLVFPQGKAPSLLQKIGLAKIEDVA